jgi:hypothetical protein
MTDPVDLTGFTGWVTFAELPNANVPSDPGVCVALRPRDESPAFLDVSPAGHFKGKDPTVPVALVGFAVAAFCEYNAGKLS